MLPIDLTQDLDLCLKYNKISNFLTNDYCIFYGFNIENRYDEERHLIDKSLKPVRLKHNDKHFYGVICEGNDNFKKLIKHMKKQDLDEKSYERLFFEFKINTQNSNKNFSSGIYPLDNLSVISNNKFNPELFFKNENIPFYQRISGIKCYIFCR